MRREHNALAFRCALGSLQTAPPARSAKLVSASASSTTRAREPTAPRATSSRVFVPTPPPGPSTTRCCADRPGSRRAAGAVERAHHHRRSARRIDGERRRAARRRHEARADAQRRRARRAAPRRSRTLAGDHEGVAADIFVAVDAAATEIARCQSAGSLWKVCGLIVCERRRRMPMSATVQRARNDAARQQQMAGLAPEEGDVSAA